jgi:uncharacterized protein YjbI with pentapeptide repeats
MLHRSNKTAGAERGLIETSAYDALLPYVAGPDEPPRYALHFGTVEKIGVNPRSEYHTPLAVCAFPLTEEIFKQFLKIKLPFAQQRTKYLYLLEIRPEARVFYSTPRFFNQGVGPEYVGEADESREFFYSTLPENVPQYFSEEHLTVAKAAQWGRKLMDMGIAVWVDADNESILHGNEPSQVMFFDPLSYSIVLSMDNPKTSIETRYGRDWRRRAKRGDLIKANLRGANLTRADLRGADLTDAILSEADLTRADLIKAKLNGAKLNGANLTRANLTGAHLIKADLYGADLTGADLTGASLNNVEYDNSTVWPDSVRDVLRVLQGDKDLYRANLYGAQLSNADLSDADLTEADLRGAVLFSAYLYRAYLTGADLTDAILFDANLRGADLTGADLTGAVLSGTILEGITYDENTKWPAGFTPPPSTPRPNRR